MQCGQPLADVFRDRGNLVVRAKHRRHAGLCRDDVHHCAALFGRDRAGEVERVVGGGKARNIGSQGARGRFGQFRQRNPARMSGVGGDLANATGVRHDAESPWPKRSRARRDVGGRQQILDGADADGAELATDPVEYTVIADQGAGMREGRFRRHLARSDLEDDDRLARIPGGLQRRQEGGGLAHRLDEQCDRPCRGVVRQRQREGGAVEIGLVAGRDDVAEPDILLGREGREEERRGATLGYDGDAVGPAGRAHRCGPDQRTIDEVDEAEAVRAEQPNAQTARDVRQFALQLRTLGSCLSEPGREDDSGAGACRAEIAQRIDHGVAGHEDDAEIDGLADSPAVHCRHPAMDEAAPPVHQVQLACETTLGQVGECSVRPARAIGCTEDSDRFRSEQRVGRHFGVAHTSDFSNGDMASVSPAWVRSGRRYQLVLYSTHKNGNRVYTEFGRSVAVERLLEAAVTIS